LRSITTKVAVSLVDLLPLLVVVVVVVVVAMQQRPGRTQFQ
jgi:hypothetical protein